jgi:PhnB protein
MATRPPCPPGMSWVSPYLTVKDVEISIGWYEKALGFEKKLAMPGPDGKIGHAELVWQGHSIMLGPQGANGCKALSPATSGTASPVSLYVYCPDVDALYTRAKAAGATIVAEPQTMFWGDRICGLTDPDGHSWCFATNVAEFDPTKAPC